MLCAMMAAVPEQRAVVVEIRDAAEWKSPSRTPGPENDLNDEFLAKLLNLKLDENRLTSKGN